MCRLRSPPIALLRNEASRFDQMRSTSSALRHEKRAALSISDHLLDASHYTTYILTNTLREDGQNILDFCGSLCLAAGRLAFKWNNPPIGRLQQPSVTNYLCPSSAEGRQSRRNFLESVDRWHISVYVFKLHGIKNVLNIKVVLKWISTLISPRASGSRALLPIIFHQHDVSSAVCVSRIFESRMQRKRPQNLFSGSVSILSLSFSTENKISESTVWALSSPNMSRDTLLLTVAPRFFWDRLGPYLVSTNTYLFDVENLFPLSEKD